jgi:hypothetical protein
MSNTFVIILKTFTLSLYQKAIEDLRVVDLKNELKKKNLKLKGTNIDLIKQLSNTIIHEKTT